MLDRLTEIGAAVAARSRLVATAAVLAIAIGPALGSGSAAAVSTSGAGLAGGAVESISCASAGNCTAVGSRTPVNRKALFVVSEKHGVWGTARAVPGLAGLLGRWASLAQFTVVSCSSAGDCGAGGFYVSKADGTQAFAVSERNGIWGRAEQAPGSATLNTGHYAMTQSMSCSSAGNCSAGGSYINGRGTAEAFVVSEKHGTWGQASRVSGVTGAGVSHMTCVSAGNCLGIGTYGTGDATYPFSVSQRNGKWGKARTFPRLIALATGATRIAEITSVSCQALGNCTAVGLYGVGGQQDTVFAFRQQNGTWGPVTPIPGMDAVAPTPTSGDITIGSLSCPSQGNCTVGGDFTDLDNPEIGQPYVATQKNGIWQDARLLPGVAALSAASQFADFAAVTCRSAGNCSAAGLYLPNPDAGSQIYVSTEKNGVWHTAVQLPGLAALSGSSFPSDPVLSCGAAGNCSLGGSYFDYPRNRPYLATQKNGVWGSYQHVKGISP